ncbi:MAG: hypothetical protein WAM70_17900 [Pyrinomonadaceae bacterium]
MSNTAVSIAVYATYLGGAGVGFMFIPNVLLQVLGLPPTNDVWIRLFGLLAVVLAAKGYWAARRNHVALMQFDVYTRTFAGIFITMLVVIGLAPRLMLILAGIDIVASIWTQVAIFADTRSERTGAT